jgi:hypothetical protein
MDEILVKPIRQDELNEAIGRLAASDIASSNR